MPPGKLNTTKRFAVRLSLVTGSTLATVIGAQSLASVNKPLTPTPDPVLPAAVAPQLQPTGTVQVAIPAAVTATPVHAAPVITVLRHAGQTSAVVPSASAPSAAPSNVAIKPPSPVQLAAPAPVIVQAPGETIYVPAAAAAAPASQPVTRSSRR